MSLREEATSILQEKGLFKVLEKYGMPHPVGSYLCDLMAWEDLDISMECDAPSPETLYQLTGDINALLTPYSFEGRAFKDGSMFYSCETKVDEKRWSINIWFRDRDAIRKTVEYCESLRQQTEKNPEKKEQIVALKRELMLRGMYGIDKDPTNHYHSGDVYRAILEDDVKTVEEFLKKYPLHKD